HRVRTIKVRGHFPTEQAAPLKCIYMAVMSLDHIGAPVKMLDEGAGNPLSTPSILPSAVAWPPDGSRSQPELHRTLDRPMRAVTGACCRLALPVAGCGATGGD